MKKEGYAPATRNGHLCWLSRLMYRAVSQGTIHFNPFEEAKYKVVNLACGIHTPLGYHVGRYSFGTLTLEAGIPIESIAKMMGHSSITSTQIYAQITDQKIARDMDKLIKCNNK